MKATLTILLSILCCSFVYSQDKPPSYEYLAKAAEIWGIIKYFHPDKPGNTFDSAFAANVPAMLEATNQNRWREVLVKWLAVLKDPCTKVEFSRIEKSEKGVYEIVLNPDSVLLVTISGTSLFDDYKKAIGFFKTLRHHLPTAKKGMIFDLRQESPIPSQYEGFLTMLFEDVNSELATDQVPQYKTIYHSGFKTEVGITSGGYKSSEVLENAFQPGTFHHKKQKVVWIVNRYSELPVLAIAQQASGVGFILSDITTIEESLPLTTRFVFSDSLTLKFKTKAIALNNGHRPFVNYQYSASVDPLKLATNLTNESVPNEQYAISQQDSRSHYEPIAYPSLDYPDVGYRVLAAAKIFTVIEAFFPYYDLMDKNWRSVLPASLPEFVHAKDKLDYGFAVAKMYAHINDSHGYISGNLAIDRMIGQAPSPLYVEWIENKVVITQFRNDSVCRANNLAVGDVVQKINGVPVGELMKKYELYFAHSTKESLRQRAAQYCLRGPENEIGTFTIQNIKGQTRDLKLSWSNFYNRDFNFKHSKDTIALINKDIGYADLTRMQVHQTDRMFETFKNTKAIIFDMRGYPNGTAWSITPRLSDKKNVPLALFKRPEVLAPKLPSADIVMNKSFTQFIQTVAPSDKWKYGGKTVMLINQDAISQAEHTGLFFESMNNTIFIGSPTAGANGDVTRFNIPGNMTLNFSGQGVWHVNEKPLQRVGLQPHVLVRPTIKGIRAGKDEVLEKAVEWIESNVLR